LNHISISQDLYMGQPFDDVHAVYCYFGSGIILSGVCIVEFQLQEIFFFLYEPYCLICRHYENTEHRPSFSLYDTARVYC